MMKSLCSLQSHTWTRTILTILAVFMILFSASCSLFQPEYIIDTNILLKEQIDDNIQPYPEMKFIVFSDAHIYDRSYGTEGSAFSEYLANDRKLLVESEEIFQRMVEESSKIEADFVLVTGDVTKDGELNSHKMMSSYLRQIESQGKKVYVIPGNHDILNGLAEKFSGDQVEPVENVTPSEYAQIYADYGFVEALYADTASLSYISEPVEGLWLFALDSNRYMENKPGEEHIIDGKFQKETLQWLEEKLILAAQEQKAVLVMMHHGVLEHYEGQEKYYGEYVVDDFQDVSRLLARYNARLVFTGHYHAQDITRTQWPEYNKFLYDIETGSLITYPNPYRVITISPSQTAEIHSYHIGSIPGHPEDFPEYAYEYAHEGITGMASRIIQKFKGSENEANAIGSQVADAFLAHYAGDEHTIEGQELIRTDGLSIPAWIVVATRKGLVTGLWHDLEPPDNELSIDLKTGEWKTLP